MVSTRTTPALPVLLLGIVLCLGPNAPASAQAGLADPTRPPAMLVGPARPGDTAQAAAASRRTATTTTASTDTAQTPRPAAAPQLQSLQLPRDGGAPSALIDGRLLHVGERLGDWTVQAIDTDAVWLRHGRGALQRLALLPALNPGAIPPRPGDTGQPLHLAATTAATTTATRNVNPHKEP